LEKEKGLKISHSTIAAAIKTADEYFEVFTRKISACIQAWVDYAHPCFSDRDALMIDVLFDNPSMLNALLTDKPALEYIFETGIDVRSAVQVIQNEWVPLPDEFKMDCLPYFMTVLNEKMSQEKGKEKQDEANDDQGRGRRTESFSQIGLPANKRRKTIKS
jgi:hypothetical protein